MSASLSFSIDRLTVRYPKGVVAVKGLSLEVKPGEIFGLVGPNGSGKSTLLNTSAGLLEPVEGRIRFGSQDLTGKPTVAARTVSLMSDPLGVYSDITVYQYLDFFGRAWGFSRGERAERIKNVVEKLGLRPWLNHEVDTLSAGWQRRAALARIYLVNTPVLLLDEPAAGLDVLARNDLMLAIQAFRDEGRVVIVTSHILSELELIADRFGIIHNGQWVPVETDKIFFLRSELPALGGNLTQLTLRLLQEGGRS